MPAPSARPGIACERVVPGPARHRLSLVLVSLCGRACGCACVGDCVRACVSVTWWLRLGGCDCAGAAQARLLCEDGGAAGLEKMSVYRALLQVKTLRRDGAGRGRLLRRAGPGGQGLRERTASK